MESHVFHLRDDYSSLSSDLGGKSKETKSKQVPVPMEISNNKQQNLKNNNHLSINLSQDLKAYNEYAIFPTFKNTHEISEPFQLVISVLKFLGNSPISSERVTIPSVGAVGDANFQFASSHKVVYTIKYFSIPTIVAAIIAAHTILLWVLFLVNIGLGFQFLVHGVVTHSDLDSLIKEEESSSSQIREMVQNTYCVTSSIIIVELFSRWWHARKFIEFLNKWEGFEKKMNQIFPHYDFHYDFSALTNFRDNLLLFYVTYPCMILLPAFLVVYCSTLVFIVKIMGFLICFQFIVVSLIEDVKVIMSYKALQLAFNQVRGAIAYYTQNKGGTLTPVKAQGWRNLILLIREQCDRASRYQKFEELARMVGYIAIVTMFVFIILNGWEHAKERGDMLFILSFAGYGSMLIGRMYFKAVMAESITSEELLLAKEVMKIDSRNFDAMTLLELKALVDVAVLDPAKICFGNYVVLNKRLLLGISSQVVTYLIVLMQFSQPGGAIKKE